MDDVGVVAGLVRREPRLALDDGDRAAGARDRVRRGEADDAAADDDHVVPRGGHGVSGARRRGRRRSGRRAGAGAVGARSRTAASEASSTPSAAGHDRGRLQAGAPLDTAAATAACSAVSDSEGSATDAAT